MPYDYNLIFSSRLSRCGICKDDTAANLWFNGDSDVAHKACIDAIVAATRDFDTLIQGLPGNNRDRNLAHVAGVREVEKFLEGYTIKIYAEQNGMNALKELFDSVGAAATRAFAAKN